MKVALLIKPTFEEKFAKSHLRKDMSLVDTRTEKAFLCEVINYSFSLNFVINIVQNGLLLNE